MLSHKPVYSSFGVSINCVSLLISCSPPSASHHGGFKMKQERYLSMHLLTANEFSSGCGTCFESVKPWRKNKICPGRDFLRQSKAGWGEEGDASLEAKILEFMECSSTPLAFPTKEQLIEAGRMDLVAGILREGGWLASGWDLDEKDYMMEIKNQDNFEIVKPGRDRASSSGESSNAKGEHMSSSFGSSSASEEGLGVEGILNRLENERKESYGLTAKERNVINHAAAVDPPFKATADFSNNVGSSRLKTEGKVDLIDTKQDFVSHSFNADEPDSWRSWSLKRAGNLNFEFEAGDIDYGESKAGWKINTPDCFNSERDDGSKLTKKTADSSLSTSITNDSVRSRLRNLETELSSVLQAIRSQPDDESISEKENKRSSEELLKLSDAWEFQENEIIRAQDRLRSIRAKLAVMEGKMSLAIIESQKLLELKQRRLDDARRALKLLRTAYIVWPSSASEVLLAGSFDGWVSQRKMEKSRTGIFSLYLKLYPGRYEIKFIVDGEWRIDPLRPVVRDKGYENNLLVVS